jgi:hypothetical protein
MGLARCKVDPFKKLHRFRARKPDGLIIDRKPHRRRYWYIIRRKLLYDTIVARADGTSTAFELLCPYISLVIEVHQGDRYHLRQAPRQRYGRDSDYVLV